MSLSRRLHVLSALDTLKNAPSQLLDVYKPLVEAVTTSLEDPLCEVHRLVTDLLWDLGHPQNLLDGGHRSLDELIPTNKAELHPGFKQYFLALDVTQWLTDYPLILTLALQVTAETDLNTSINDFVEAHQDSLDRLPNVRNDIRQGIKLLVCEHLGGSKLFSIFMAYHHLLESLPFDRLRPFIELLQATTSIVEFTERNKDRFDDLLGTTYKKCKPSLTRSPYCTTNHSPAWSSICSKDRGHQQIQRGTRSRPLLTPCNTQSLLTNQQRRNIHRIFKRYPSCNAKQLGRFFGVCRSTIVNVKDKPLKVPEDGQDETTSKMDTDTDSDEVPASPHCKPVAETELSRDHRPQDRAPYHSPEQHSQESKMPTVAPTGYAALQTANRTLGAFSTYPDSSYDSQLLDRASYHGPEQQPQGSKMPTDAPTRHLALQTANRTPGAFSTHTQSSYDLACTGNYTENVSRYNSGYPLHTNSEHPDYSNSSPQYNATAIGNRLLSTVHKKQNV
ncbi:MAG: hypothetical protein Q9209_003748 [Squamulea sp. 1 TL-2023]